MYCAGLFTRFPTLVIEKISSNQSQGSFIVLSPKATIGATGDTQEFHATDSK